jgi:acyl carrier protein
MPTSRPSSSPRTPRPIEPQLRRLVAEQLGVDPDELARDVSLREDLAADSLDLVELAVTLEHEFGIDVPERLLEDVRSYGELVETTVDLVRARRAARGHADGATPRLA